jgi:hypothetical protein
MFSLIAAFIIITAFSANTSSLDLPLFNPGFEKGTDGWRMNVAQFGGMFSIDRMQKHGGNVSLKVSDPIGTSNPFCSQTVLNLEGNATYRLRAWGKGEVGESSQAAVKIEYYDGKNENTSGYYGRVETASDGNWQVVEVIANSDADTKHANLLLRLFGKGTIYYDDVEFTRTKEPSPLVLVPLRIAVSPLTQKDIIVQVRLGKGVTTRTQPIFTFDIQRFGSPEMTATMVDLKPKDTEAWEATVHLPAMQPGQYKLRCSLAKSQVAEEINLFVPLVRRKPEFLSDTGTILVNGKPFFPIGMYHVVPSEYETLVAKGFNCVQGQSTSNLSEFLNMLTVAKKAGIMVDVPFYTAGQVMKNLPNSLQKIRMFGSHDNILNWKIIDEPDTRPDIIDEVPSAYEQLKQADPSHPLLLTIDTPENYSYWSNFCDILQIDPYPIPSQSLTMVSDYAKKAKVSLQPWQNLTVVLQCGWKLNPMNQPTFEEARCMVYLALIHGAKGIFWYAMHDPGWNLTETPLWKRFKEINGEIRELSMPAILGTKVEGIKGIASPLQGLCLKHEGRLFLLLANPIKDRIEAMIELPMEIKRAMARGETKVDVSRNSIKLKIPGPGVELVIIE